MLAAGFVTSAFGQIQVAGTLQVNVDATAPPVGAYTFITNNGAMGGVFVVTNYNPTSANGTTPQILAVGGTGAHGILLDGNSFLNHYTAVTGNTPLLPPATMVGATPVFSVEAWMCKGTIQSETAPVAWGTRTAGQNCSCNWGYNTSFGGFSWQNSDQAWASVPTPGMWHHLVWTYDGTAVTGGVGTIRLYRDGVLDKAAIQTTAIAVNSAFNILLGAQHAGTGIFGVASGVLAKVRIHDGVLSASQVANNYNFEVGNFTIPTASALATAPLHRYSFNQPATNNALGLTVPDTGTAAGSPAIIKGTSNPLAAPIFDGNELILPNYGANSYATNAYVDLPNGMLSSLSSSNGGPGEVTLELWVEPTASKTWAELLYFGNSTIGEIQTNGGTYTGTAGIVLPAQVNTTVEQSGVRSTFGSGNFNIGCYLISSRKHILMTWDEPSNTIKFYHQGIQVGQFAFPQKMNAIVDVNNWLGRSGYSGDQLVAGNYREFRIYNRVLSPAEVHLDYLVGPNDAQSGGALTWNGNLDGNWNTGTFDWLASGISTNYTDGSNVRLDDTATGTTTINLTTTLTPKSVSAVNYTKSYTIGGVGNISGTGGLTKVGNSTLTFTGAQTNDYTGPTTLVGGKLIVSNLANGGSPSAIGASGTNFNNLAFSGGTLSYQGAATNINRGYLVTDAGSTLEVLNSLGLSGAIRAVNYGNLTKTGVGTLIYNSVGTNQLSAGTLPGYNVAQGTVVFDGTAGPQTNNNLTEIWVGGSTNFGGNLIVSNATLLSSSWLTVGRGNGSIGNLSTLTLNNGIITVSANGFSMGFDGGLPGNLATQVTTLNGASAITCAGNANLGESAGSFGTLFISNNSWLKCVTPRIGLNAGSTGAVYIANSGALTNPGFTSIGASAVGRMVVKDTGVWNSTGDFNVSDIANSIGELDISNNATILCNGGIWVGKSAGTIGTVNQAGGNFLKTGGGDFLIGGLAGATTSVGTWNLSGGLLSVNGNFQPGTYGQGTFNQTGGTVLDNATVSIGRYAGGVGVYNISSGLLFMTNTGTTIIVGEGGTGTLNISGTGLVVSTNTVNIGNLVGGAGTINLNGGTLVTKRVFMGNAGASSTFNFNGGLLQAASVGATADFMSGLSTAYMLAGGARIDTGTNNLTIAQDLNTDYTGGGLTKLGTGSLTLGGYLYYVGPTVVSAGTVNLTTHDIGGGSLQLADSTSLGVQVLDNNGNNVAASSLAVGTSTGAAMTFNLGSFGNPSAAPLNVSGGTVNLNAPLPSTLIPAAA